MAKKIVSIRNAPGVTSDYFRVPETDTDADGGARSGEREVVTRRFTRATRQSTLTGRPLGGALVAVLGLLAFLSGWKDGFPLIAMGGVILIGYGIILQFSKGTAYRFSMRKAGSSPQAAVGDTEPVDGDEPSPYNDSIVTRG